MTINLKTVWNTGIVDTNDMEISNKNLRYSGIVQSFAVGYAIFDWEPIRKPTNPHNLNLFSMSKKPKKLLKHL